jgi:SAM-dependent methyltransferase
VGGRPPGAVLPFTTLPDMPSEPSGAPSLRHVRSQTCTASQFGEETYDRFCAEIGQEKLFHRKQWEYVYILAALEARGLLSPGACAIGFGCGKEPLAAVMARRGCQVTATDLSPEADADEHWGTTSVKELFYPGICSWEQFESHVTFRSVDMNDLPKKLGRYDFVWSSCALEHLGSLEAGIAFILNATRCLKPGGIAVHTTEFNISSDDDTLESPELSLYRKRDILALADALAGVGCRLVPCNFETGDQPEDIHIDLPPYSRSPHLKLKIADYVITSLGMIIEKDGGAERSGARWQRWLSKRS